MTVKRKEMARRRYQAALESRKEYEQAVKARRQSPEFLAASQELTKTVRDLERRGLLQYDAHTKRYDLHPVVRGIAAGGLRQEEKENYGQRVVDYFSRQAHNPYDEAETLDDVRNGLHLIRTLLQMGRHKQAYAMYLGDLASALLFNLEANAEVVSLLRPFFRAGWATLPEGLDEWAGVYLTNDVGLALRKTGDPEEALAAFGASLLGYLSSASWRGVRAVLSNISKVYSDQNRLAKVERCILLALDLGTLLGDKESLFRTRLHRFWQLAEIGRWAGAAGVWELLDPMGRDWQRASYRPGGAEYNYARFRFWQGDLTAEHLDRAEVLAKAGRNRYIVRDLHQLRGEWQLEQGQWAQAGDSLREAVRMAREVGQTNAWAETQLALARFHLNQLPNPRHEAEQLAKANKLAHRALADLWLAIGDPEQAKKHALAAYEWAWADGEPYVHRYELDKARALLEQLGAEIPDLPAYDPAKDEKLPWEDEVVAAIEKLRAEKEAEKGGEMGDEE